MTTPKRIPHVLILGTGIAGLSAAIKFAGGGVRVTVVAKSDAAEGATRWAQGGIATVWSKDDSIEEHKRDTFVAGADLCRESVVDLCVREGPERVKELIDLGVEFTRSERMSEMAADGSTLPVDPAEAFDLHREGGHGQRRILHAADLTGWAIEKALLAQAALNPLISILEDHCAIDLITEAKIAAIGSAPGAGRCLGAYVLNVRSGHVETLGADLTVLATGGAGKVYLYTSNPDTATGDGIAMAYRAGAKVANLEFIQFHPTCLFHPTARTFLITEALRGEGAILRNLAGDPFMDRQHELGSLAPRDIVARGIDLEMKRTGDKHVLLDCSPIPAEKLKSHFPNIYETCLGFGIDITQGPIPVVPAAHYTCGGVVVDERGLTDIEGLYAVGEVSCTGLHGANRLASNSLLEAVVYAHRVYVDGMSAIDRLWKSFAASEEDEQALPAPLPEWSVGGAVELEEQIDIAATWHEIRSIMWNYVGIVRSNHRLVRARRRLEILKEEINGYYWSHFLTRDLIELRNLVEVADLIVRCAQLRQESRGLHYTVDYPERDDVHFRRDTMI
ncbi:MAG: L-aspartate oxidase [Cryobacterium sp.]|nr:L-aspartate oxidase [Oligoflexia bacterium]